LWIATVFPHMVCFCFCFCFVFCKIIFVDFIFLILSWLLQLQYVRKALYISSQITINCYSIFPIRFFFFFNVFFSKIIFVNFIFLIWNWLRITITTKAKSYGKSKLFSQNTVDCYSVSPQGFFFPFFCVFFISFFSKLSLSILLLFFELVII